MASDEAAFLAARLGEKEASAAQAQALRDKLDDTRRQIEPGIRDGAEYAWRETAANPARALREVEAGRRILARYENLRNPQTLRDRAIFPALAEVVLACIRDWAAVWCDHPDYQQDWEP